MPTAWQNTCRQCFADGAGLLWRVQHPYDFHSTWAITKFVYLCANQAAPVGTSDLLDLCFSIEQQLLLAGRWPSLSIGLLMQAACCAIMHCSCRDKHCVAVRLSHSLESYAKTSFSQSQLQVTEACT